jgi:hypothetical protein
MIVHMKSCGFHQKVNALPLIVSSSLLQMI